jgi:hypothetical protein
MRTLNLNEMSAVGGGDDWAGTPAGRAPSDSEVTIQNECQTVGQVSGSVASNLASTVPVLRPAARAIGMIVGAVARDVCVDNQRRDIGGGSDRVL